MQREKDQRIIAGEETLSPISRMSERVKKRTKSAIMRPQLVQQLCNMEQRVESGKRSEKERKK